MAKNISVPLLNSLKASFHAVGLTVASSPLNYYNYLGIEIDNTLSWNLVITNVYKKLRSSLSALQQLSHTIPPRSLHTDYSSYCLSICGHTTKENIHKIQQFQNRAARIISNDFDYNHSGITVVKQLYLLTVLERRDYLILITVFKCLNDLAPHYLSDLFVYVSDVHNRVTRQTNIGDLYVFSATTAYAEITTISCGTDCLNISEMPRTSTYSNTYANLGFCHNGIVTDFLLMCIFPFLVMIIFSLQWILFRMIFSVPSCYSFGSTLYLSCLF